MTEPDSGSRLSQTYAGACHCGRVRFEVTTDLVRASECNCSICRKKGYLHHGRSWELRPDAPYTGIWKD